VRILILTTLTMVAFAANSLLTRGALGHNLIDAPSFTIIRLATGAAALALLLRARERSAGERGSWWSAVWLGGYAVGFTLAYTRIGAGVGALLLFGAVQVTMIGVSEIRGERSLLRDWLGLAVAMAGLLWLTLPGASAPNATGSILMAAAGACWGFYSIAGRSSRDPLSATTGNFWRATLLGTLALGLLIEPDRLTTTGVLMATASGAIASGVGYTVWYAVLPSLGAWRGALVQLTVPVLAGLGAALFLGEAITSRLVIAGVLVAAGVGMNLQRPRSASQA
jgi:drug/metabolite transporter (DMT)-like permease